MAPTLATVGDLSAKSQRSSKSIIRGIGTRIEALVAGLGFKTQRAMAKGLGISKSTLNRYIQTDRCPDPHILLRLAKLGVSVDALLLGDRPQPTLPGRPKTEPAVSRGRLRKEAVRRGLPQRPPTISQRSARAWRRRATRSRQAVAVNTRSGRSVMLAVTPARARPQAVASLVARVAGPRSSQ